MTLCAAAVALAVTAAGCRRETGHTRRRGHARHGSVPATTAMQLEKLDRGAVAVRGKAACW
jgi:hypothetical protein